MQVANNARAIEKHLKKRYQEQIESVKKQAQQEADELIHEYEKNARKLEQEILTTAKHSAQAMHTKEVAQAKTTAKEQEQEELAQLADKVIKQVQKQYLQERTTKEIMSELKTSVTTSMQKHNSTDYKLQEDADNLYVQANTEEILVEDSFAQRLAKHKEEIIEHIKHEIHND